VLLVSEVITVLGKELGGPARQFHATHLSEPLNKLLKRMPKLFR
jgi:hypothetical protein